MPQSGLSGRQGSASTLDHCGKRFFIVNREISQYTAIKRYISPLESVDQPTVGQPIGTRLCVDTGNP
jgi:hypothetical protein